MITESTQFAGISYPKHVVILLPWSRERHDIPACIKRPNTQKYRVNTSYYSTAPCMAGGVSGFYLVSDFAPGLRWEWCDKVEDARINHTGWFIDDCQDETIRGVVFRLPHGRGFLIGHSMGESMSSSIDRDTIWDSERQAAHAADRMAERAAEAERDYQEAERARLEDDEAQEEEEEMGC